MKNLLTVALIYLSIQPAYTQFILEAAHILTTGRSYITATDNQAQKLAQPGPNQIWNYTNLKVTKKDTIRTGMPFWYKGHTHFPNANYATISNSDMGLVFFYDLNDSGFYTIGGFASSDTSTSISKIRTQIHRFPSTYLSTFEESDTLPGLALHLGFDIDTAGPLPFIDSLRISFKFKTKVDINGWGKLNTPIGTFDVLRHNTRQIISQFVMVYANGNWIAAPQPIINFFGLTFNQPDTMNQVMFMTNNGGYGVPLLKYEHRNKDTTATMNWLYQTPVKSAINKLESELIHVYPNPCSDVLIVELDQFDGRIILMDMTGKLLINLPFKDHEALDVSELTPGIYLIHLVQKDGTNFTKKVIVH